MKKIFLIFMFLIFSTQVCMAYTTAILLKADDSTSFMYYELHGLAYEAASKKDYENSFRIYEKIAKQNDDRAEYNVGMMYLNGLGVKENKKIAYKWLRKATKDGNKEAKRYFKSLDEYNKAKAKKAKQKELEKIAKSKRVKQKKIDEEARVKEERKREKEEALKTLKLAQERARQEEAFKKVELKKQKKKIQAEKDSSNLFLYLGLLVALIAGIFAFLKMKQLAKKTKKVETTPNKHISKYKTFDSLLEKIELYHSELLKKVDISPYKQDKKKMQVYYMFLAGAIDYLCQTENFSESEQRRMFNTFIGKTEGKENLTAITQSILEGQKKHNLYHAQAAGGISATQWKDEKSEASLLMLKKVLDEQA